MRLNLGKAFWSQPPAYRNHQLFFAAFTIAFAIAGVLYGLVPGIVAARFADWDALLGGSAAGYPEPQNRVWISLAAANVVTLSLMCGMLVWNLRVFSAVRWPLLFMKSVSAGSFLFWWGAVPGARSLCVAAVGDIATALGIWYFSSHAVAELAKPDASPPVPLVGAE